jgi:hypothetical protein
VPVLHRCPPSHATTPRITRPRPERSVRGQVVSQSPHSAGSAQPPDRCGSNDAASAALIGLYRYSDRKTASRRVSNGARSHHRRRDDRRFPRRQLAPPMISARGGSAPWLPGTNRARSFACEVTTPNNIVVRADHYMIVFSVADIQARQESVAAPPVPYQAMSPAPRPQTCASREHESRTRVPDYSLTLNGAAHFVSARSRNARTQGRE